MKTTLFILFLLPLSLAAQSIVLNQYDNVSKNRTLETSPTTLKDEKETGMEVGFKAVGTTFFLTMKGYGIGAGTIQANDPAIFLLDNDSTVSVASTSVQTYDVDKERATYKHEYKISVKGLELLSLHNLKAVRKYDIKGHTDIDVPQAHQYDLRKTCLLFLSELAKYRMLVNDNASYGYIKSINIEDASKFVGDSIRVCGKVFNSHYLRSSANKPVLLNVGTADRDILTVVIYENTRRTFREAPEKYLLDKEVCITGRIELYNNRPQIVIKKEEDITLPRETPSTTTGMINN